MTSEGEDRTHSTSYAVESPQPEDPHGIVVAEYPYSDPGSIVALLSANLFTERAMGIHAAPNGSSATVYAHKRGADETFREFMSRPVPTLMTLAERARRARDKINPAEDPLQEFNDQDNLIRGCNEEKAGRIKTTYVWNTLTAYTGYARNHPSLNGEQPLLQGWIAKLQTEYHHLTFVEGRTPYLDRSEKVDVLSEEIQAFITQHA